MNPRPSGYERSDQLLSPYHCVPDSALLQAFRRSRYSRRPTAYTPVPRRTVEETVETRQRHRAPYDRRWQTRCADSTASQTRRTTALERRRERPSGLRSTHPRSPHRGAVPNSTGYFARRRIRASLLWGAPQNRCPSTRGNSTQRPEVVFVTAIERRFLAEKSEGWVGVGKDSRVPGIPVDNIGLSRTDRHHYSLSSK